jgi:hypothetical protein
MMKNPSANSLIEVRFQFTYPIDGELPNLQIIQFVFLLELLVQRTLVALKSMPVTCAAGQRMACFAA